METLTTYEVDTGKRAKLVRKVGKLACKPAELDAYWANGDKVTDKCKDSVAKVSGYLMGASAIAGAKSLLVMLRGDRLGELAVMDAKTLAEKSAIKMPWCDGAKKEGTAKADEKEKGRRRRRRRRATRRRLPQRRPPLQARPRVPTRPIRKKAANNRRRSDQLCRLARTRSYQRSRLARNGHIQPYDALVNCSIT